MAIEKGRQQYVNLKKEATRLTAETAAEARKKAENPEPKAPKTSY